MIDTLIEICGWIGAFSYSVFAIPQAVDALKKGKTEGISSGMILLLFGGGVCSIIYVLPEVTSPLFYNFLVPLISTSIILKYHYWPRKNNKTE